jgi:hypothetical protein
MYEALCVLKLEKGETVGGSGDGAEEVSDELRRVWTSFYT